MYALVQFLTDKVKAIVPIEDIKNFKLDSFVEAGRAYEVFCKSPDGDGSGWHEAVILLVAETEELIEQRIKRAKLSPMKELEELLARTRSNSVVDEEDNPREIKERQEKRSICEKAKSREMSQRKLRGRKRKRTPSPSSEEDKRESSDSSDEEETESPNSTPSPKRKRVSSLSSESSSDEDDLILKSELKRLGVKHNRALQKLKLKRTENIHLKERIDQLQERIIGLQTQLISLLSADGPVTQNRSPTHKLSEAVNHCSPGQVEKNGVSPTNKLPEAAESNPSLVESLDKEGDVVQAVSPTDKQPKEEEDAESNPSAVKTLDKGGNKVLDLSQTNNFPEVSGSGESNSSEVEISDKGGDLALDLSRTKTEEAMESKSPSKVKILYKRDKFYLHDDGSLMQWKEDQMELAPGVVLKKRQWEKIRRMKKINQSRLVRALALVFWDPDDLKDRSVTGRPYSKREGKTPLTPVKVDAVQNMLRFWLKECQGKEEPEAIKLSSGTVVRKLLAEKICDVKRSRNGSPHMS